MGKKKLEVIDLIQNKNSRNVTYCKRKRGLIKKAIELSKLCNQNIYLAIFDVEKQKLVQYCSSDMFSSRVVSKLTEQKNIKNFKLERYTNDQYQYFERNEMIQLDAVAAELAQVPQDDKTVQKSLKKLVLNYQPEIAPEKEKSNEMKIQTRQTKTHEQGGFVSSRLRNHSPIGEKLDNFMDDQICSPRSQTLRKSDPIAQNLAGKKRVRKQMDSNFGMQEDYQFVNHEINKVRDIKNLFDDGQQMNNQPYSHHNKKLKNSSSYINANWDFDLKEPNFQINIIQQHQNFYPSNLQNHNAFYAQQDAILSPRLGVYRNQEDQQAQFPTGPTGLAHNLPQTVPSKVSHQKGNQFLLNSVQQKQISKSKVYLDEIDDIIDFANNNIKSVYEPKTKKTMNINSIFGQSPDDPKKALFNQQEPDYLSLSSNFDNSSPDIMEDDNQTKDNKHKKGH